jgi:hypothetical protein
MATIDAMSGRQFEEFLAWCFEEPGVEVELTRASGDRGADLLVATRGVVSVVQAKRHALSSRVGGGAVREAIAARTHYKAKQAVVVTNAHFSNQAQETARENVVTLIDRDGLGRLLAAAQERQAQSPKDAPERAAARAVVAPAVAALRESLRGHRASPAKFRTTDLGTITSQLGGVVPRSESAISSAAAFVVGIRQIEAAYSANRVEQAYDLLVPLAELKRRCEVAVKLQQGLRASMLALGALKVPEKYSSWEKATELLNAIVSAAQSAVDALQSAGLDRDEDLMIARNQARIDACWSDCDRQHTVATQRHAKLNEAYERARDSETKADARRSTRRPRSQGSWSRW